MGDDGLENGRPARQSNGRPGRCSKRHRMVLKWSDRLKIRRGASPVGVPATVGWVRVWRKISPTWGICISWARGCRLTSSECMCRCLMGQGPILGKHMSLDLQVKWHIIEMDAKVPRNSPLRGAPLSPDGTWPAPHRYRLGRPWHNITCF